MQIKLGEIMNAKDAFFKLLSLPLPIKTSYRLSKAARKFDVELKIIEEKRNQLVMKYGEKNEQGNTMVKQSEMGNFMKEFNDMLELSIEINIEPIDLSLFEDIKLSPLEIANLDKLIIVEKDDKETKKT